MTPPARCFSRRRAAPAHSRHQIPLVVPESRNTAFASYETQIYTVAMARLTPEMRSHLDALLVVTPMTEGEEEEELPLNLLRLDPGPVGVESALSEIAKLRDSPFHQSPRWTRPAGHR